jgi:hypothetical protein
LASYAAVVFVRLDDCLYASAASENPRARGLSTSSSAVMLGDGCAGGLEPDRDRARLEEEEAESALSNIFLYRSKNGSLLADEVWPDVDGAGAGTEVSTTRMGGFADAVVVFSLSADDRDWLFCHAEGDVALRATCGRVGSGLSTCTSRDETVRVAEGLRACCW